MTSQICDGPGRSTRNQAESDHNCNRVHLPCGCTYAAETVPCGPDGCSGKSIFPNCGALPPSSRVIGFATVQGLLRRLRRRPPRSQGLVRRRGDIDAFPRLAGGSCGGCVLLRLPQPVLQPRVLLLHLAQLHCRGRHLSKLCALSRASSVTMSRIDESQVASAVDVRSSRHQHKYNGRFRGCT